jgi:hypothetical protein
MAQGEVAVVDTATNTVVGDPIQVGDSANAIAITPGPLALRLALPHAQSSLARITANATCTILCQASGRGRLIVQGAGRGPAFALQPVSVQLLAKQRTSVRLGIEPRATKAARKALRAGKNVKAQVTVRVTAGSSTQTATRRAPVKP